jgi:hypothetical protein
MQTTPSKSIFLALEIERSLIEAGFPLIRKCQAKVG